MHSQFPRFSHQVRDRIHARCPTRPTFRKSCASFIAHAAMYLTICVIFAWVLLGFIQ